MISGLNKFLLIILALLQFVAPLVHAHSEDATELSGLHLPGLESIASHQYDGPALRADARLSDIDHAVVGIGSGIKQQKEKLSVDVFCCNRQPFPAPAPLLVFEINFSPQTLPPLQNPVINSQSPRAPPFFC